MGVASCGISIPTLGQSHGFVCAWLARRAEFHGLQHPTCENAILGVGAREHETIVFVASADIRVSEIDDSFGDSAETYAPRWHNFRKRSVCEKALHWAHF